MISQNRNDPEQIGEAAMKNKALKYAKMACDTMMKKFNAEDLPPKGSFHYHAGVFLSGMMNVYSVCREEKYFNYIKAWVDSIVIDDGVIRSYSKGTLDSYMAAILLFPLYEKTGEKKYRTALEIFAPNIRNWLKNEKGGFWHKEIIYRNQMWLDGLYMVGPLQARLAHLLDAPYFLDEAARQAFIMQENMQDEKTKLLYHAWDCSGEAKWADSEKGCSPEFWGRAMGWYVVAILDILDYMPKHHSAYQRLCEIERKVLSSVANFQDKESGMWYQVLDKGDRSDNWLETSCSCLFVYALNKAMQKGIIDKTYEENVKRGFEGILKRNIKIEDGKLYISGVCTGTSASDYDYYVNRPTSVNDLHGMGAFLLMCASLAQ